MARIIAYPDVVRRLESHQLQCVYHNSGAFAFENQPTVLTIGWIGPADSSIRAEMRELTVQVSPPHDTTLAMLARRVWEEDLPNSPAAWLMPKSHWAFELSDGNRRWLPGALDELHLPTAELATRADASAIEFERTEAAQFERLVAHLLDHLQVSDFAIAFPGKAVFCTIHHHRQLWWQTTDENLGKSLRALPSAG